MMGRKTEDKDGEEEEEGRKKEREGWKKGRTVGIHQAEAVERWRRSRRRWRGRRRRCRGMMGGRRKR